jgi:putative peptidoglycan lipid II flippase
LGAVFQIVLFLILAPILGASLGPAGLALADTLAFTSQAVLLLALISRRYPSLLSVGGTLWRSLLGAALAGLLVYLLLGLSFSPLPLALFALAAGGLLALPFMWPEIKLLIRL